MPWTFPPRAKKWIRNNRDEMLTCGKCGYGMQAPSIRVPIPFETRLNSSEGHLLSEKEGERHDLDVIVHFSPCRFWVVCSLGEGFLLSFVFLCFNRGRVLFTVQCQKVARMSGNGCPRTAVSMSSDLGSVCVSPPNISAHRGDRDSAVALRCPGRGRI